jgi:hypothetical protein
VFPPLLSPSADSERLRIEPPNNPKEVFMNHPRWFAPWRLALALLIALSFVQAVGYGQAARLHPRRIAVFGSSVANGTGDELAREGYRACCGR